MIALHITLTQTLPLEMIKCLRQMRLFEESLKQNLVKRGGEDWVVLNFNTVKSPARGNLFKGPLMSTLKVGEGVCIKDGGTLFG